MIKPEGKYRAEIKITTTTVLKPTKNDFCIKIAQGLV